MLPSITRFTETYTWSSAPLGIAEMLSTIARASSVVVNLVVSELLIVRTPPGVGDASTIVTTAADGFSTTKSACALTAVNMLSAVVSFDSFGLKPSLPLLM